jgi:flagellar hook-associated protein 3
MSSESYVESAGSIASRVKELALSQVNATAGPGTRRIAAVEIGELVEQAISIGNARIGSDYIFGGRSTNSPAIDGNGFYTGESNEREAEINEESSIKMSVLATEFLTVDMNPQLNSATPLSALRGGSGIPAGTFTISDRSGTAGTVTVTAGMSVGNLVSALNASGANVTASISPDNTGIRITDNTPIGSVTGPMTITDTSGTAAKELGLAGSRNVQYFFSTDLDPALDSSTLISDLFGGDGLSLQSIILRNGVASSTVSFAGATTVGDLLTTMNGAGVNATVSINSAGTGLSISSLSASTVAYAQEVEPGNTAELLGLGGGRNLIQTLKKLQQAMVVGDTPGILGLMGNISSGIETASLVRGEIGARMNRIESTAKTLQGAEIDSQTMLSYARDADMVESASNLAMLQTAYQATIKSSAAIIQPTLLDYIR